MVAPQGPGIPTLYTLQLSGNRSLQTYLDPAQPGFNEWHTTFIGADGNEMPMAAVTDTATAPGTTLPVPLTVRRLDPIGHFVADLPQAVKGSYRFDVTGTTATGDTIQGTFTISVHYRSPNARTAPMNRRAVVVLPAATAASPRSRGA